ncbi:unnamed protein product [Blepharisma stoltei]|uniref:Alcohol dehydrogenase n=1 Tax=Blepharisma stoltei TaxID=1481888 RepID=A0AAU9IKZ9_9CILI|nr:unnamed protein product [Blepharisma stoltei]
MAPEEINRLNGVNCYPMAYFTNILLNQFAHRGTRSAVINVSSILGKYPLCGATVYNATKCYNYGFSMAMAHEYKDIADVLTVCPGRVKTNMNVNEKIGFFCPLPDKVAEGALRDLGTRKLSYGAPGHDLTGWSLEFLPESFRIGLSRFLIKKGLFNP